MKALIRRIRQWPMMVTVAGMAFVNGCHSSKSECSIRGEVLVNDRPTAGIYVVFHPLDGAPNEPIGAAVSARTDDDGGFLVEATRPGNYAVTVFWPKLTVNDGETTEGEDRFVGRYRDLRKPVILIEVDPGENTMPQITLSSR